jgi:hypothetical protein
MIASNSIAKVAIIFRLRCKMWSCPYCASVNQKLWTARAYNAGEKFIERGQPVTFITLTSHEKLTAKQSWYVWPKAWKKLHARAKYRDGKAEYCMVPEQHEDGRIHVHMISTWSLSQGWWKDNGRECGLGFMAEEEFARTAGGVAHYVSKYVGKQLGAIIWPKGFRRVRTSHDFPKLPPPKELPNWQFQMIPTGELSEIAVMDSFHEMNYQVRIETSLDAWAVVRLIEGGDTPEAD